jgi:hypothetical protein
MSRDIHLYNLRPRLLIGDTVDPLNGDHVTVDEVHDPVPANP